MTKMHKKFTVFYKKYTNLKLFETKSFKTMIAHKLYIFGLRFCWTITSIIVTLLFMISKPDFLERSV